jgi:hypothetical protein
MMARRILAGALLGVVMTLSLAGVASAQSNSNSNSNKNTNSSTSSSSSKIAGSTARTGAEMWIPLMLGGLVITVAIATRVGLTRAATRTP